jgi:primosomal replication protein N
LARRLNPGFADAVRQNLAVGARVLDGGFVARAHERAQVIDFRTQFRAPRGGVFYDAGDTIAGKRAHETRFGKIVLSLSDRFVEAGLARQQLTKIAGLIRH